MYSDFPDFDIPPMTYPADWGRVREQLHQAPGTVIEDAPKGSRARHRDAFRNRLGMDSISFSNITRENSRVVAGQILARRVLATGPGLTKVEKVNSWMGWVNETWKLHQQVLAAEQVHSSESPQQDIDQLRSTRREQLRLFLEVCDEGNILEFGLRYPRPRTDSQLDAFINSERFAILVNALKEAHGQMEHATSRGENVEVRYSSTSS